MEITYIMFLCKTESCDSNLHDQVIQVELPYYILQIYVCMSLPDFSGQITGGVMVLNATFNNISFKLWQSLLSVEEAKIPRENQRPVASH